MKPKNLKISFQAMEELLKFVSENMTHAKCAGVLNQINAHLNELNPPKKSPKKEPKKNENPA